ncbi:YdbH domain-containing protein [Brevundimonas diminuta]|uniref:intermembrane phospholipid transport protein YdbH family protein n=1 Tax=Brevundimonas diminuta TaxID=293 RepID=UPI00209865BB|nr:YdbH domain-containing protein [Brevundimonas diminuta]MCO8031037.1 YdbH domain-containing protein [Brevundimonas diminuta]
MTEDADPSPTRRQSPRRNALRGVLTTAGVALMVVLVLAAALYLNRRAAARELLVGWLDRKGIDADVEVERLEANGFVGKISIGDPKNPDFKVERVEVDYAVGLPWSKAGLGVTPSRVRLVRPIVRAAWKDGKLSLGSLDPLVEEFTGRPPRPDSRAPLVIVERGQARIDTEYGPINVLADARIDDGKLMRLSGRMPAASLKSGGIEARGLGGVIEATTTGDRLAVELDLQAEQFAAKDQASGEGAALHLKGDLPYPDMKTRRGDGRVSLTGRFTADAASGAGVSSRAVDADLDFDGQVAGWINRYDLRGKARLATTAGSLAGEGLQARALDLRLTDAEVAVAGGADAEKARWSVTTPARLSVGAGRAGETRLEGLSLTSASLRAGGHGDALEVQAPVALQARSVRAKDFSLRGASGALDLDVVRDAVTRIDVQGALKADHAAVTSLGAATADDLPEMAALKRALGDFALNAPRIRLSGDNAGLELTLPQPITARPANGGELRLEAHRKPLFASGEGASGGGALSLTSTRGVGLPDARFEGIEWRLTRGGFAARLKGRAGLDFGPARDIAFSTQGELASSGGRVTYTADDCIPLTIGKLDLGENSVEAISGRVCPGAEPLITAQGGAWSARGRLADVQATAPFLEMQFSQAEGRLAVDGAAKGLSMRAAISKAQVSDVADPARFLPLQAKGEAQLADEVWTAGFDLTRLGHEVGRIDLRHDGRLQAGGAGISAPSLIFTEHGLQPADLSPLVADYVKSPVEGSAGFEGRFDWNAEGATSSGVLTVPDLDFTSPAGKVQGLKGRVEFTSLTPLITAPDQKLTADRVQTVTPLTDFQLTFSLNEKALTIGGGQIQAASGRISVEPLSLPLTGEGWGGVIVVEGVQLNELLKSANLQDKAELDAVVSGRLPFTYDPKAGWRIVGGVLNGVRPGRLSIQPEVFDDLAAGGGANSADLPPNTMQDLAYQAMQDLAISDLTAEVNSLDEGRLGVRFRINGRHDPPQREQLRLTFMELIRRDFMNKKLNLPSDTPIDLTLDTTWNANQIVSDLLEYARRGETPVLTTDEQP